MFPCHIICGTWRSKEVARQGFFKFIIRREVEKPEAGTFMGRYKKTTQEFTTELHCLELPTITAFCDVKKFESIFSLGSIFFIFIIDFFINLQMTTE